VSAAPAPDAGASPAPSQRALWAAGDFSVIGLDLVLASEWLCEAVALRAGERVLDVATGSGNTALAAARRRCEVTGIDFVPALLERAALRAEAEGVALALHEADAQALPMADGSFDVVLSSFGVMFAPDPVRAAAELARVCRPGGRIGLACWTPDGFIGAFLAALAGFVPPPPPGSTAPTQWGVPGRVEAWLGGAAAAVRSERRTLLRRYRSMGHYLDEHRDCFGPTVRAFERLEPARAEALAQALVEVARRFDVSDDDTLLLPCDYLEIVAVRR
jgi:SAM-dependent methyltransferase